MLIEAVKHWVPSFFYKVPLQTVLIVPFVLQIFGTVGLVGYLSFKNGEQAVNDLADRLSRSISDRIEGHLQNYLSLPHLMQQIKAAAVRNGTFNIDNFESLERQFFSEIKLAPAVDYIYYGNKYGDFLGVQKYLDGRTVVKVRNYESEPNREIYQLDERGNRTELIKSQEYDPRSRPWYEATVKSGAPTWSSIYISADLGVLQITPATPIYDEAGNFMGVIASNLLLAEISKFLNHLEISKNGEAFIVEPSGEIVASSTEEAPFVLINGEEVRLKAKDSSNPVVQKTIGQLEAKYPRLKEIEGSQTFSVNIEGKVWLGRVTRISDDKGLDWLIAIVIPKDDFMQQIYQNTRTTIFLCIAALIGATGLGIITAWWIAKPIFKLNQASVAIASGKLEQNVKVTGIKELETLAHSFNGMAEQLQDSFSRLETKNADLERAKTALAEAKEQLEAVLNAVPGWIFSIDRNGVYLGVNHYLSAGFNLPAEEIVGKKMSDFYNSPEYEEFMKQFLESDEIAASIEIPIKIRDRDRYYLIAVQKYQQGTATVSVGIDITQRRLAEKERERLAEENLRMGAELDVVRQLQKMILPKPEELQQIRQLDIAGFMESAEEVGGDYYDVLDYDDTIAIGIGDVTGHGLESGILMVMTQTAVRTLKEVREADPVRFLDILNRTIYRNAQRLNGDKNLTLVMLNYCQGQVTISGQHEEILVVRVGGKIERIDTIDLGLPIGLDENIAPFISHRVVQLNPGDGIVLYTDGITEAKNLQHKQYGIERLSNIISQNWEKPAEEIKGAVIADLRGYVGEQKLMDDITLIAIKQK